MKTLILATLAATLAAAVALPAAAQTTTIRERPNGTTVVTEHAGGPRYRVFRPGDAFAPRYAERYTVVNDFGRYRLHGPRAGFHWVRAGRDALLVNNRTGRVAEVVRTW